MAGLSLAFSAFLGLSVSAADILTSLVLVPMLIHQSNNVHNTRIQYPIVQDIGQSVPQGTFVHSYVPYNSILKKANKKVKAMSAVTCSVADIGNRILAALIPPCTSRLPRILFVIPRRVTTLWLELKVGRYDRPYYRWWSIRLTRTE